MRYEHARRRLKLSGLFLVLALGILWSISATYAQVAPPATTSSATLPESTIKALQEALNKQGIVVKTDGVLNEETRNAIRKFQSQHHLPVTGEADKATLNKLGVAEQRGAAPGTESTGGQGASPTTGSMMSPQSPMRPNQGTIAVTDGAMMQGMMQGMMQTMQGMMGMMQGQMGGGRRMAPEPQTGQEPSGRMQGPMMPGMMGMMQGQMGGGRQMTPGPQRSEEPSERMQGPTMKGMMQGMIQMMHGMKGMMQGQMRSEPMMSEMPRSGSMPRGPMKGAYGRAPMDCPMGSDSDQGSGPAMMPMMQMMKMMQMMQGMMQMMQMMQGQMQSAPTP